MNVIEERHKYMATMKQTQHSDYWLDDINSYYQTNDSASKELELLKMSMFRRSIANYVQITTGKRIPVYFSGDTSYTTGKSICIAANLKDTKSIDITVGLALHESSHIVHTDFSLLSQLWMDIPDAVHILAEKLHISKNELSSTCKFLWNYIEDRYIDRISYNKNVGYRPYYVELYNTYFHCPLITKALVSDLYRTLSIRSYLYRISNLTNPSSVLDALPNLDKISKCIDLPNIIRLKNPTDRRDCAFEVVEIILSSISDKYMSDSCDLDVDDSDVESVNSNSTNLRDLFDTSSIQDSVDIDSGNVVDVLDDIGGDDSLSPTIIKRIAGLEKRQRDLIIDNVSKKSASKSDLSRLKTLEESAVKLVPVGTEFFKRIGIDDGYIECVVYNNVSCDFIRSPEFCLSDGQDYVNAQNDKVITAGISAGIKMGRQLQLRNQEIVEKFTHKNNGRIDRKLFHEAYLGIENVFYTSLTTKYKPITFHIDVDMSSSMYGSKWDKTLKLLVTLSKAIDMLDNVELTIGMRTVGANTLPYYYIVYDSKKDHFSKIKNYFKYIMPSQFTPEGLCFEAILDRLSKVDSEKSNFFINISDGQPYMSNVYNSNEKKYTGEYYTDYDAIRYTRNQVNKIRKMGYNIISYFISYGDSVYESDRNAFRTMYGQDSQFLNVNNLSQITNSLNSKLMETYTI